MSSPGTITYLTKTQINRQLWDRCIGEATNGLIYGYSFYLDHVCYNWDALVLNNYEAVMPLPWRKKYGIHYLYQPFLTAQLGLFGNKLTASLLENFLNAVPKKFKLWEFPLNQQNLFALNNYPLYQRVNYVLPLHEPYETLYLNYRENIKRNIKKSFQYGCNVKQEINIDDIIRLAAQHSEERMKSDFENFKKLYMLLKQKSLAKSYGVFSKKNELLASAVFTFSHNRAYYILVGNHPNGRTLGASHTLIDAFSKDHVQQNLLLDFEGSDLQNLAFFYSSFGSQEEEYAAIKLNRLPWYIKWMKH